MCSISNALNEMLNDIFERIHCIKRGKARKIMYSYNGGIFDLFKRADTLKFLPPANAVWGKVIFSQVSVCPQEEGVSV